MKTSASTLELNGRKISYRRVGDGLRKVLFFHGFPGSSAQVLPFLDSAKDLNLEVICLDRPGYNQTSAQSENQFQQTVTDAMAVMQNLNWKSCEVISVSGGTPFLFSFVQAFPHFVSRVTVVSGLGPIARAEFASSVSFKTKCALKLLPHLPGSVFQKILPSSGKAKKSAFNPVRFFLPASRADLKAMQNTSLQNILMQALQEAFMQSGHGPQRDAGAYLSKWSTSLPQFTGPITIWHGTEDMILSPTMAETMAKSLPQAKLNLIAGEGHYSLAFNRIHEMLAYPTTT
jgi:pimeloyl-ACP methyl ester carboxylesterase